MNKPDLERLLQGEFGDAKISVLQDGNRFEVSIVSDSFQGKTMVQRHRQVYQLLGDAFANNELHALSLNTVTSQEAATGG